MKLKILFITLFVILLNLLTGCSLITTNNEESEQPRTHKQSSSIISSVRLYLAKGSFATTEFEQFSLSGNSLFFECGKIQRGKNIPAAQGIITLNNEGASELILMGMEILGRASVSDPLSLATPGDLRGFADSGKIILNLQTKDNKSAQLNTGLNEVAEPATILERNILKLTQTLRAQVKEKRGSEGLCGNESFFGIS